MMPEFEYYSAKDLNDAAAYLSAHKGEAKIIAGGTDLILQMEQGKYSPKYLLSLNKIPGLDQISVTGGTVSLGANVTHRQAELSPYVKEKLPALHDAVRVVGSVQVRNTATIAGNICNGVPSADTACPLLVYGAKVNITGPGGSRQTGLTDFWTGAGKTVLAADEIVTGFLFPEPGEGECSAYIKYTRRNAMDLSMVGFAVSLACAPGKKRILSGRVALGTVAPVPMRSLSAEDVLRGAEITDDLMERLGLAAQKDASPRSSWRASAEYRKDIIQVLAKRTMNKALDRI